MNKISRLFSSFVAAILLFCACSKDDDYFTAVIQNYNDSKDYISSSTVFWSNGDRVRINNTVCDISVDGSDNNKATIHSDEITPYSNTYYASYPANITDIRADGTVSINLPRRETYAVSNGSQVIHSVMAAASTDKHLAFENLCALLHFRVNASGAGVGTNLCAIEVSTNQPISGAFSASFGGGTWNVTSPNGINDTLRTLYFPTPVALTSDVKDFYLLVPAVMGITKFRLRYIMEDASSNVLVFDKKNTGSGSTNFAKGYLYTFEQHTYDGSQLQVSGGSSIEPLVMTGSASQPMLVSSESTWDIVKNSGALSNNTKYITLVNDITLSGSAGDLRATIDGNGHTVTLSNPETPMFNSINGGKVSNIVLDATREATPTPIIESSERLYGTLSYKATEGSIIDNCVNRVDFTCTIGNYQGYVGGLLGKADRAAITNCRNEGNISSDGRRIGGIVGYFSNFSSISGCINIGDINFTSGQGYSREISCGGIVGYLQGSDTIKNCRNEGNIRLSGDNGSDTFIGGVVGNTTGNISCCSNHGEIICSQNSSNYIYIGGVLGNNTGSSFRKMINCFNEGHIAINDGVTRVNAGGLIGRSQRMCISNSYAFCDIRANEVAGIAGANIIISDTISNCYYHGNLSGDNTNGIAGISPSANVRFIIHHCYYPLGLSLCGANGQDNGNNAQLSAPCDIDGGGKLVDRLNAGRPYNGKTWVESDGHVTFGN